MIESFFFNEENNNIFFDLTIVSFVMTLALAYINSMISGVSLFLVSLISLSLAYPVTKFTKDLIRKEIDEKGIRKKIFKRYKKEFQIFLAIFIGTTIGFYISNTLGYSQDFSYEEAFIGKITGEITGNISIDNSNIEKIDFWAILGNNLIVALLTFIISFLVFSGLVFVLVWNASIFAYFLYTVGSHKLALIKGLIMMIHAFFEVSGYIFAGLAGGLLAFRLSIAYERRYTFKKNKKGKLIKKKDTKQIISKILNTRFFSDLTYLCCISICFIVIGAFIEIF